MANASTLVVATTSLVLALMNTWGSTQLHRVWDFRGQRLNAGRGRQCRWCLL